MKRNAAIIAVLVAASLAGGYWLGAHKTEQPSAAPAATPKAERKILYYRNPMGLPDTSPVPKKDSMGMDYVPVYEGDVGQGDQVAISPEKVQKLGVTTESASLRELTHTVRAVGTIQVDERRQHTVAPKFEGWIERLYVNTTGQPVARGQALMEVYSPELVSAQQEYAVAWQGFQSLKEGSAEAQAGMRQVAESALLRLRNWDIAESDIQRLRAEGKPSRVLTLRAPVNGVVLEKPAVAGMRFSPGDALFKIADLSAVWLTAEVFEQDLGSVHLGQTARITVSAYPGKTFSGKVAFVYPTVNPQTRTAQVRIELPNPGGALKPAMYASVELAAKTKEKVLAIPASAVLHSGTRDVALVEIAKGRYEPRPVRLGMQTSDYVQVLEGISEGEKVVTSANFLIDAESNLKAALTGFGGKKTTLPPLQGEGRGGDGVNK